MERPNLGLAYVKTAGPFDWLKRQLGFGGDDKPVDPRQQVIEFQKEQQRKALDARLAAQKQQQQQPATQPTLTPTQQAAALAKKQDADAAKQKSLDAWKATEPARKANRDYMDRQITAARARTPAEGGRPWAQQQAMRERSGNWAWDASKEQADRANRTNNVRAGAGDPRRQGWEAATRDFSEQMQDRQGRDLDSFTRRMQTVDPAGAEAARRKGDDTLQRSAIDVPTYDFQGRGSSNPIQWSPTTYEQAERMGVLQDGMPGSAWRQQPEAPQHNAQQDVRTTRLNEMPNAPGRVGRMLETEESLRAQGVAENGPQGWRYDAARRRNPGLFTPRTGVPPRPAPAPAPAAPLSNAVPKQFGGRSLPGGRQTGPIPIPTASLPKPVSPTSAKIAADQDYDVEKPAPVQPPPVRQSAFNGTPKPAPVAATAPAVAPRPAPAPHVNPYMDIVNQSQVRHQNNMAAIQQRADQRMADDKASRDQQMQQDMGKVQDVRNTQDQYRQEHLADMAEANQRLDNANTVIDQHQTGAPRSERLNIGPQRENVQAARAAAPEMLRQERAAEAARRPQSVSQLENTYKQWGAGDAWQHAASMGLNPGSVVSPLVDMAGRTTRADSQAYLNKSQSWRQDLMNWSRFPNAHRPKSPFAPSSNQRLRQYSDEYNADRTNPMAPSYRRWGLR